MEKNNSSEEKKKELLKLSLEKVTLSDAGIKNKYGLGLPVLSSNSSKNKVSYPSIYLNTKEAPDLKGSEAGQEKTIVIKAVIRSHELSENSDNKNESFCLEIRKIGVIK